MTRHKLRPPARGANDEEFPLWQITLLGMHLDFFRHLQEPENAFWAGFDVALTEFEYRMNHPDEDVSERADVLHAFKEAHLA